MSVSMGKRIFSHFSRINLKRCSMQIRIGRFSSVAINNSSNLEENAKSDIPISEPGKISAAVLKKFSDPFVLENLDSPKILQENEVLVDVHYCALNASDALLARNLYTFEPTLPKILGYEFVGKLIQVGKEAEKQGYKIGDKIVALNKECYGGLAKQCIAAVDDIWRVPSGVKSVHAVSLLDNYITALLALERATNIQEEDMILINVGISGIGLAAVDLATNVFQAEVISVCATEDVAALAREKGVLASFKYKDRKLLKQIEEIAAEKNIKEIFKDADGEYFKKVLRCFTDIYKSEVTIKDLLRDDNFAVVLHHLSREGRVIIAGTAVTMTKKDSEKSKNGFRISGFNLAEYKKTKPESYRQAGDDVLQFIEDGLIDPTIALTVGLSEINDALEFIFENKSPGKVIIDLKDR
ncbi:PREDICTED: quinone oxidoreductase-like protein 2 [Eufriesea mexicana]|uniref:quinone oxidoreductase-like protein 2 n=1 Tax=Eufriesea mexicana TaxID=516756 RepID=UPI00083C82B3|nr:PREDICTED: quinone oxidoreductase-like protein 2 [Eufriesea mexicana]